MEGQWLTLHASTVESPGSITGQGTRILQVVWCSQKKEEKEENVVYIYVCVCVCVYIYIYIYEHYSAFKKKKIWQFTAI